MTIATLRPDGWPQATTVGYVSEGLDLYFLCGPNSQKAHNLAVDDRVWRKAPTDRSSVGFAVDLATPRHSVGCFGRNSPGAIASVLKQSERGRVVSESGVGDKLAQKQADPD